MSFKFCSNGFAELQQFKSRNYMRSVNTRLVKLLAFVLLSKFVSIRCIGLWGKQFSIRHGVVRLFHISDAWKSLLNLNCNSGCVSKDWKDFVSRFFAVTALSDFILKRKFKYVDELAASVHLAAWIMYK